MVEEACASIPYCSSMPFGTVMAAWKRSQQRHTTLAQTLAGIHVSVVGPSNPPGNALALTLAWCCLVLVAILTAWAILGKRGLLEETPDENPSSSSSNNNSRAAKM